MAYQKPADIDGYVTQMAKADMRVKAQLAEDLVLYLSDSENSIECTDLGLLIDGLIPWMTGSHYKIAQRALEAFTELIVRLGHDFNAYTSTILPHVIDRLGDSRDTVREKAQLLLHKLMECRVVQPQTLLDKLNICFKHKNGKVREEFLQTIVSTLNEYGTQSLSVKVYIPPIVSLLGDPSPSVRDAAIQTLVEIYKHVGDKLRIDLKKRDVPPTKVATLEQKFDEARNDGLLLPSALTAASGGIGGGHDELDRAPVVERPTRLVKRTPSATPRKPLYETQPQGSSGGDAMLAAGSVSVEIFEASFENVPQLTIFSQRDMDEHMKSINTLIGDKNVDWEKRVDALKKIRSLLMLNVQSSPSFVQQLKDLSIAFLDILKELRSQVIREACITLAYMSKVLKSRLDQFTIYILQELINLIQNSAKVISSSGTLALKFVLRYTHAPKIIPILTQNLMLSKSKDIRSTLCEMLILLFEEWPTKALEKHNSLLREALKKGIGDADNDARRHSRCAFWLFRRHFPELADSLYGSLDISTQRALERERDNLGSNGTASMSVSLRGSNSSLNSVSGGVIKRRQSSGLRSPAAAQPPVHATSVSTENLTTVPGIGASSAAGPSTTRLQRAPSLPRTYNRNRSGIPVATTPRDANPPTVPSTPHQQQLQPIARVGAAAGGFRSVSAVDTAAAQRARARAQYSTLARMKVTSGTASLQGHYAQQARAKKTPTSATAANTATPQQPPTPERKIRSRAGVSQSQPTSRSTSPSSKMRDMYGGVTSLYRQTGTVPKKPQSGIPRSLANSRETSPTRSHTQFGSLRRHAYGTSSPRRPPLNPGRPVLAQKILQQSREAENALADALSPGDEADMACTDFARLGIHRKISRDESDESEASSVCSERSYDSYRRGNDSFSWNGSRTRLDSSRTVIDDIETIIQFCASSHWSERKDGLINLTQYLGDGKMLTQHQLQCVLDLFRKMFMDPHIKVYALFLDTVNELILSHSNDLHDWLFILLTRLFNKLGTDLLGSMNGKIWKTLQLIYEYFPPDLQLQCVFRILVDNAQTPNVKTRQATLRFLTQLALNYCTASQFVVQPQNQQVMNLAIQKIIQTSLDQKSIELKSQARLCIVALYNCNPSQMTLTLGNLPKQYQDTARAYIQHNMRRSVSGNDSPSSPLSSSSPKPLLSPQQGPYSLQNIASPRSRQASVEVPTESMNTEEVYKNLRKTTAEIQNYSFESKLDRDTNSKDSGISQMGETHMMQSMTVLETGMGGIYGLSSNGIHNGHIGIGLGSLEKDDSCNGSKTQSATTTESNTPENTVRLDGMEMAHKTIVQQQQQQQRHQSYSFAENGELILEKGVKENDVIKAAIVLTHESAPDVTKQVLENLQICIKHGSCELPIKNFKAIMKMLLHLMESQNNDVLIASLHTLGRIVRSTDMKACWSKFLELILLKIIDCYKISKEVSREIDTIVVKIAGVLPLDISVNILNPVIATGEFPANLCALKILTELTQKQGKDLTDNHLDSIMPNVVRLADDSQSMVRKAAVFCIVKLYIVMGEEKVKPKFSLLNASKIRLLNVYIAKALGAGGGGGGSSKGTGSSGTVTTTAMS
ncbi:CLIP-associating protein isoform X1 [Anopheles darlingi]|uniref:CLIP-associating protein isoform X1 n=1 Tax=Anopheles darlingi TaxID=43151 RepID=UPI0021001545|nr:CLIP-associating protein isoform X1 [Anopheles darlingi]